MRVRKRKKYLKFLPIEEGIHQEQENSKECCSLQQLAETCWSMFFFSFEFTALEVFLIKKAMISKYFFVPYSIV